MISQLWTKNLLTNGRNFFDRVAKTAIYVSSAISEEKVFREKEDIFIDVEFWPKLFTYFGEMDRQNSQICTLSFQETFWGKFSVLKQTGFLNQNWPMREKLSEFGRSFSAELSKVHFSCPEQDCEDKQLLKEIIRSSSCAEVEPEIFGLFPKKVR